MIAMNLGALGRAFLRTLAVITLCGLGLWGTAAQAVTTTTTLSTSSSTVPTGQNVTFTAVVAPSTAFGYVTFLDGGAYIGSGTVTDGVATLTTAFYAEGVHSITASYGGISWTTPSFDPSVSSAVVQTVSNPVFATSMTLSSTPTTVLMGQPLTVTATVTPSGASGYVTFLDGGASLGSALITNGVATLSTSLYTTGTHVITASYPGISWTIPSYTASTSQAVNAFAGYPWGSPSSTSLSATPSTAAVGQTVTLQASVTPATANGTVVFLDGSASLGAATLNAGIATLNTSFALSGSHTLTAMFLGDSAGSVASTSAPVVQTVGAPAGVVTTTTLSATPTTVITGQAVMLTATVNPSSATGTVTFKDGSATLGTGTLNAGVATLSTSFSTTGTHSLSAYYAGNSANLSSTSTTVSETVNNPPVGTHTNLLSSSASVSVGQSLTLTATVSSAGTPTSSPTGSVTFKDGATTLGVGTLNAGVALLSTSFTTTGTHSLSAVYTGDAANVTSTSTTLSQTVIGPLVALPAPPNPSAPVVGLTYDAQNQPTQVIQAPGITGYNLTTSTAYDPLGRPKTVTNPQSGVIQIGYDGLGRVTTVIDPRNLATQSPRDGLGQVTQLQSPDSGTANLTYDLGGNLSTRTDSRGVLATYSHDALNRLTQASFNLAGQTSQNYSWTYDQTGGIFSYGIGRLTTASFPEGSTSFVYDPQGRVLQTAQTVNAAAGTNSQNVRLNTFYAYDAGGHVTQLIYPSGRTVSIGYTGGLPSSLGLAQNAVASPIPLLGNIQYAPFGPVQSWNWQLAAGVQPYAKSFDTSGRVTRYPLMAALGNTSTALTTPILRDLSYDPANRITAYTHYRANTGDSQGVATPELDQSFAYDANGRLTQATVASPAQVTSWAYTYDANGNRTSVAVNGNAPGAYSIDANSNRITQIATPPVTLSYDAMGNTTSDGSYTLGYNLRGRLATVGINGNLTTYSHDNAGQRVRKFSSSGANSTLLYAYDTQGHLLGEYDQNGSPVREYIWLDDQPVAVFTPDPAAGANANNAPPLVYFIYADHLNTPRAVVDSSNRLRWSWVDEPFGTTPANSSPLGLGSFVMSLRFPGQVYDAESGMHQNWHREYVPGVGRYAQSDPIGLAGGINTYSYVEDNPLSKIDPKGLTPSSGGMSVAPWVNQEPEVCNKPSGDECYAKCAHLLPSPTRDLQASEYRACYRRCMGTL